MLIDCTAHEPIHMMTTDEIRNYLPHRPPFLLVDHVEEVQPGIYIRGYKDVRQDESLLGWGTAGGVAMPAMMVVEAMAQLAGILAFQSMGEMPPALGTLVYLGGIRRARFVARAVPSGERIDLAATVLSERRPVMKCRCTAHVNALLISEAEIVVGFAAPQATR